MRSSQADREFYVVAHNIRSLHNVGSIFRIADAFNITKIYLTGYTGRPDHCVHKNKIGKVALGAENFVPWEYFRSAVALIKKLKKDGVNIVALENNLNSPKPPLILRGGKKDWKPRFPLALVLGEERRGVSRAILQLCDKVVEIPMQGKKKSLNVSVAFGIAAFWIV